MVKASPYVIRNISMVLENEDFEEAKMLCEKFSARYSEDIDLVRICDRYREYQETQDMGTLDELKMSLERLQSVRALGTNGDGKRLWYNDKRPSEMQVVRVV